VTTDHSAQAFERISIALMSEARKWADVAGDGPGGLADRLTGWATDVRRLGIEYAQQVRAHDATSLEMADAVLELHDARQQLVRVREILSNRSRGVTSRAAALVQIGRVLDEQ
jgi:Xaa-Pro aminopeptidase